MKLRATLGSNTTGQRQVADLGGIAQIGAVDAVGEIVISLHLLPRPANHRDADRVVRTGIAAGKPV
jgi:hypothetical protein